MKKRTAPVLPASKPFAWKAPAVPKGGLEKLAAKLADNGYPLDGVQTTAEDRRRLRLAAAVSSGEALLFSFEHIVVAAVSPYSFATEERTEIRRDGFHVAGCALIPSEPILEDFAGVERWAYAAHVIKTGRARDGLRACACILEGARQLEAAA